MFIRDCAFVCSNITSFKALGNTGNSSKHSSPPFMPRRVCQNKAFSHVCHLCQNTESLEVVVLPFSIFLCLILRNEPSAFIHSARVLEERDGAEEDWRTSYSMKRGKRKLCHLPECLSMSLTLLSPVCVRTIITSTSFHSQLKLNRLSSLLKAVL